jgi:hypothetical protein
MAFVAAIAAGPLMGCLPASTTPQDGGAVTYTKDVQPILIAKCSPCHAGQHQGQHDIAINYADALKPVQSLDAIGCWYDEDAGTPTMPKKIGECASISVMRGWMPMSMGCDQPTPPDPSVCVPADQQAVIAAWVAAGMPQ